MFYLSFLYSDERKLLVHKNIIEFIHPGLLHIATDLQRMKSMVAAFSADYHSQFNYTIRGPNSLVTREANFAKINNGTYNMEHDSYTALATLKFLKDRLILSYSVIASQKQMSPLVVYSSMADDICSFIFSSNHILVVLIIYFIRSVFSEKVQILIHILIRFEK